MIDLDSVKSGADLLAICGRDTRLKRAAGTNGGEWKGACPFCGGRDRFYMQPRRRPFPKWYCRRCTPQGGSVIDYIAGREHLDPKGQAELAEICRLAGSLRPLPAGAGGRRLRRRRQPQAEPPEPAYAPPDEAWQAAAQRLTAACQAKLWGEGGEKALGYLKGRGLREETIRKFGLGYATGEREGHLLYARRGILIPCAVGGVLWYLKLRLPARPGGQKYTLVVGSRPRAIFNADALPGVRMALFCEGEFDAMIAAQEFGEVMPAVTLGSATNLPDLAAWGAYLVPLQAVLTTYDADLAGSQGAHALAALVGERARMAPLPEGVKDINEYFLKGGDLLKWVTEYQSWYCDPFFG